MTLHSRKARCLACTLVGWEIDTSERTISCLRFRGLYEFLIFCRQAYHSHHKTHTTHIILFFARVRASVKTLWSKKEGNYSKQVHWSSQRTYPKHDHSYQGFADSFGVLLTYIATRLMVLPITTILLRGTVSGTSEKLCNSIETASLLSSSQEIYHAIFI